MKKHNNILVVTLYQLRGSDINKISYDNAGDTLSILLSKKQITYAEEHGVVIVSYDKQGKPVEIEILNAKKFTVDLLATILKAKSGEKQLEVTT